jgi:hypothetical protein
MAGGSGGSGGSPNGVSGAGGASTPVQTVDSSFLSGVLEGVVFAASTVLLSPELGVDLGAALTQLSPIQDSLVQSLLQVGISDPQAFFATAIQNAASEIVQASEKAITQDAIRELIVAQYKNNQGELGGAGGNNNATITLAGQTYGPYGQGGGGGDSVDLTAQGGFPGGVVLWWGDESNMQIAQDTITAVGRIL